MLRSLFSACLRSSTALVKSPAMLSASRMGMLSMPRHGLYSPFPFTTSTPLSFSSPISLARRYCSTHLAPAMPVVEDVLTTTEEVIVSSSSSGETTGSTLVSTEEIIHLKPMKYIEFDCSVCQVHVAKTFSKHSYEKGVVIIKCPGCQNLHLIADNLGFTGYGQKNVEEMARERGESITTTWERGDLNIKQ